MSDMESGTKELVHTHTARNSNRIAWDKVNENIQSNFSWREEVEMHFMNVQLSPED